MFDQYDLRWIFVSGCFFILTTAASLCSYLGVQSSNQLAMVLLNGNLRVHLIICAAIAGTLSLVAFSAILSLWFRRKAAVRWLLTFTGLLSLGLIFAIYTVASLDADNFSTGFRNRFQQQQCPALLQIAQQCCGWDNLELECLQNKNCNRNFIFSNMTTCKRVLQDEIHESSVRVIPIISVVYVGVVFLFIVNPRTNDQFYGMLPQE